MLEAGEGQLSARRLPSSGQIRYSMDRWFRADQVAKAFEVSRSVAATKLSQLRSGRRLKAQPVRRRKRKLGRPPLEYSPTHWGIRWGAYRSGFQLPGAPKRARRKAANPKRALVDESPEEE